MKQSTLFEQLRLLTGRDDVPNLIVDERVDLSVTLTTELPTICMCLFCVIIEKGRRTYKT